MQPLDLKPIVGGRGVAFTSVYGPIRHKCGTTWALVSSYFTFGYLTMPFGVFCDGQYRKTYQKIAFWGD